MQRFSYITVLIIIIKNIQESYCSTFLDKCDSKYLDMISLNVYKPIVKEREITGQLSSREVIPSFFLDKSDTEYEKILNEIKNKTIEIPEDLWTYRKEIFSLKNYLNILEDSTKRDEFLGRYTLVHFPGSRENPNSESIRNILHAYLKRGNYNVMIINWKEFNSDSIIKSIYHTYKLSTCIAQCIGMLIDQYKIDEKRLHFSGYSIGGHLAGLTAGKMDKRKPERITAFDPLGKWYGFVPSRFRLDKTDADFVEVIHTDSCNCGINSNIGHVDYYINGGFRTQPGCTSSSDDKKKPCVSHCSHSMSWRVFVESVVGDPERLVAKNCKNYKQFIDGECEGNTIYFGQPVVKMSRGKYYMQTNALHSDKPLGKGPNGAAPKNNDT